MIVRPASTMFSAISFGVFCRSAPSTSAIMGPETSCLDGCDAHGNRVGENASASSHCRTVASCFANHGRGFAGDSGLVDRGNAFNHIAIARNLQLKRSSLTNWKTVRRARRANPHQDGLCYNVEVKFVQGLMGAQQSLRASELNPLIRDGKFRHRRPAWTLALLLAIAVSFWGIRYKVSLYHPAVQQSCPAAKLLAERERPSPAGASIATGKPVTSFFHHPAPVHALAALATVVQITPKHWRQLESRRGSRPSPLHSLPQSTPRPPPVTAQIF